MGNVIDEKTVKLDFDNKKFEAGTKQSLDSVRQLKKGLDFSDSTKNLSSIDKALSKMNFGHLSDSVDSIKNRFSLLGIVGLNVLNQLSQKAIDMVKQLGATFITDPIKSGLQEYETQINAIQTILANTASKGTTLEQVSEKLGELNTYADKTIYNFTEMTRNIGTFTAAGVDLNTSVDAIKGIANLAAVSGSNSQQAATAMYQLSQALSSGTVKLMDWNSVVNAGMGGQVFQDALKETARLHKINIDQMIEDEGSFRETLSEGWLSSEILTETLKKFTGDLSQAELEAAGYTADQAAEIVKLGVTANDAATKVKTLTQLTDTLKEAAQSGWTQTWELIIGDFNQAKEFWTEVSDTIGALIGQSADARNAVVGEWNALGGRTILIQTLRQAFEDILLIAKPIGDALREVFPPVTAKQLFEFTLALKELVGNFKIGEETADRIKRIFRGLFSVIDIGKLLILSFAKNFKEFLGTFDSALPGIGDWLAGIGDWLFELRNAIREGKKFDEFFKKMFDAIRPVILGIVGLFAKLTGSIKSFKVSPDLTSSGNKIGGFLDTLKAKFSKLGGTNKQVNQFTSSMSKFAEKMKPVVKKIGELALKALNGILDWIDRAVNEIDVDKILKVLNGGLFAGVLLSIKGFIDSSKAVVGAGMFAAILKSVKDFIDKGGNVFQGVTGILTGVKDVLGAYQKDLKANALLKIAGAVGILALSIALLAFIDPDRLLAATTAISAMFLQLMVGIDRFNKGAGGIKQMATATLGIGAIAAALLVMAIALRVIATLDPSELALGLGSLTILLAEMIAFTRLTGQGKGLFQASSAMFALATSLYVMAKSLAAFAELSLEEIGTGLLGMAGSLGVITAALRLLPDKGITSKAVGILTISVALLVLAQALKQMGSLSWDEVAVGMVTLAGSLTILAVAMTAMQGSLSGAAALLISAAAVAVLAVALKTMANLKIEQVGIALLALAGIFTVLGLAGYILTPVVPVLLGLAAAIFLIGAAALALGAGVLAFSVGFTALAVAGSAGIAGITVLIVGLSKLLPVLAKGIANGIVTLISSIASQGKRLAASFLSLLRVGITAFTEIIPELAEAAFKMIKAFLTTIRDNIGEVVELGADIIINFMDAMAIKVPELVDSAYKMVIAVIDGMADSVEDNLPKLVDSVARLGSAIVNGLLDGIIDARHTLIDGIKNLANTILTEFRSVLGIRSPSKAFYDTVKNIAQGFTNGLRAFGGRMTDGAGEVADDVINAFNPVAYAISKAMDENMEFSPQITPVVNLDQAKKGASELDGFLGGKKIDMGLTLTSAQSVQQGQTAIPGQEVPSGQASGGNISFVQNNYSPKELSRLDIYRNTRNQFLQAKGLVGV